MSYAGVASAASLTSLLSHNGDSHMDRSVRACCRIFNDSAKCTRVYECCCKKPSDSSRSQVNDPPLRCEREQMGVDWRGEERQWHPSPLRAAWPPFIDRLCCQCRQEMLMFFFTIDGKCILRTFGCTHVLIPPSYPFCSLLPSSFLFTFGLNIRGGAHLEIRGGGKV